MKHQLALLSGNREEGLTQEEYGKFVSVQLELYKQEKAAVKESAAQAVGYPIEDTESMQHTPQQLRFPAPRRAFTLVELLVVCAIIGFLVTLTVIAVNMAARSAKVTKTRATIQKLDTAMLQIFAAYESKLDKIKNDIANEAAFSALSENERLKIAAHFIRDLMRMELPQNWEEAVTEPLTIPEIRGDGDNGDDEEDRYAVEASPLLYFYRQEYERVLARGKTPRRAALLFLIIQNLNPEALEAFHGSEVAANDDGMLEFIDAWGNPILFLRWAPAFPDSDLQQNVLKRAGYTPVRDQVANRAWWIAWWTDVGNSDLLDAMRTASENHADPVDGRSNTIGWFLYPLIYSAGPDGRYGLDDEETVTRGREGILDPFAFPHGMPNEGSRHLDNIHNHQWYR